jgi:hypothetical protein
MGGAVSFALQPLFSWRKFSGRHFVESWMNQKADMEKAELIKSICDLYGNSHTKFQWF